MKCKDCKYFKYKNSMSLYSYFSRPIEDNYFNGKCLLTKEETHSTMDGSFYICNQKGKAIED